MLKFIGVDFIELQQPDGWHEGQAGHHHIRRYLHLKRVKARKRRILAEGGGTVDLIQPRQHEAVDAHAAHSALRAKEVEGNFAKMLPRGNPVVFPGTTF